MGVSPSVIPGRCIIGFVGSLDRKDDVQVEVLTPLINSYIGGLVVPAEGAAAAQQQSDAPAAASGTAEGAAEGGGNPADGGAPAAKRQRLDNGAGVKDGQVLSTPEEHP